MLRIRCAAIKLEHLHQLPVALKLLYDSYARETSSLGDNGTNYASTPDQRDLGTLCMIECGRTGAGGGFQPLKLVIKDGNRWYWRTYCLRSF